MDTLRWENDIFTLEFCAHFQCNRLSTALNSIFWSQNTWISYQCAKVWLDNTAKVDYIEFVSKQFYAKSIFIEKRPIILIVIWSKK